MHHNKSAKRWRSVCDAESAKGMQQFVLSQCVFDGSQRFSFVLQVLLQLPEGVVPLFSI